MELEATDEGRGLQVILFVTWLLDDGGMSGDAAWTMITHLRHHLTVRGGIDPDFLDKGLVSKTRRSGIRTVKEAKEYLRGQDGKEFMPDAPEMLEWIHRTGWEESSWETTEGRDKKMVALAARFMTDSGLRIKNVGAAEPSREDHALRAREAVAIAAFINGVLSWIQRSECMVDDELFLRRKHATRNSILQLRSKMVAEVVKSAAVQYKLNSACFSTCSFRKHFVSMPPSVGMGAAKRNRRVVLVADSTVPDNHYYTGETVGLLGKWSGAEGRVSVPNVEMLQRRGAGAKVGRVQGSSHSGGSSSSSSKAV
ncbi:hypothetical protein B484DRAFT_409306 [Ochromonadaceae sp. CCMP2298]|nr:hypothetical protein B484DRAFT_409306 [Ochromonadaceae sp. CCMP2298]